MVRIDIPPPRTPASVPGAVYISIHPMFLRCSYFILLDPRFSSAVYDQSFHLRYLHRIIFPRFRTCHPGEFLHFLSSIPFFLTLFVHYSIGAPRDPTPSESGDRVQQEGSYRHLALSNYPSLRSSLPLRSSEAPGWFMLPISPVLDF